MRLHRLTRPPRRGACALAATAFILLALAATAAARPADNGPAPPPSTRSVTAPTVVRETVVQPGDSTPGAIVYALIAIGATATAIGGGYLGARIALRTSNVRPTVGAGR
jgi:hypothetical protein